MDIQSVAAQLVNYLGSNPDKIAQFAQHPYSTTASVMGTDETISQKDMSRVLTQVAAQTTGQQLGTDDTKSLASALMGQSGDSVHALANALFGGGAKASEATSGVDLGSLIGSLTGGNASGNTSAGPSMAEIAAKSVAGGLAARGLAMLITSAMSANKNNPKQ